MRKYDLSEQYKGCGISNGHDRGLLVYHDDTLLVEEGMGIGACAFQTCGFTYFASIRQIQRSKDTIKLVASLDKQLVWRLFGIKSRLFTKMFEANVTKTYMTREKDQDKLGRRRLRS